MKQIRLSGLLAFLCFVIFAVWVPADPSIFVKLSSKVIWTIDKNAYSGIGIFFYDNDYIVTPAPETSTDYEFEQVMTLKEKLDADGIELLQNSVTLQSFSGRFFISWRIWSSCR